jgi:hypothetical protein
MTFFEAFRPGLAGICQNPPHQNPAFFAGPRLQSPNFRTTKKSV